MKQVKKLFGIVVIIITAMTALAGCASAQTGGTGEQQASAQQTGSDALAVSNAADLTRALAAELNTMRGEGSATVNGHTVTLIRDIGGQKDITIPAGVTLELTGDIGLWLYDGIILTVNGTLNTPSGRIGFDDSTNSKFFTINGSGTINLKSKGNLLNIGNGKKLILDGATLVGIIDNNQPLVDVNSGGEFILKNGVITSNTNTNVGGGIRVRGGGTSFIMTGGTISGNSANSGGGLDIREGSSFTMTGGTISDNTVNGADYSAGGGVSARGGGTSFTMTGGTISGNSAILALNGSGGLGGGVQLDQGASFTMTGGTISGNSAGRMGGGIEMRNGSSFTMSGGTIYGSSAEGSNANIAAQSGAAMLVNGSTAKWGVGGTYTRGGVSHIGGSVILENGSNAIVGTNDTLIAIPPR